MSNRRHISESENIYSSACMQSLEQEYCSSCSAVVVSPCQIVSSRGFGERIVSRIYNGGRQAIYTATVGAMLANNTVPVYGYNYYEVVSTVSAGQTAVGTVVSGSSVDTDLYFKIMDVYGITHSTIISDYGQESLLSGGQTTSSFINGSHGMQTVGQNAIANYTSITGAFGKQYISSGGLAVSTFISGNDNTVKAQIISNGGSAIGTIVERTAQIDVQSGGTINKAVLNQSATMWVMEGGTANNTTVNASAWQIVLGNDYNTTLSGTAYQSALQSIENGGSATSTIIDYGGKQTIGPDGQAWYTTISSGGLQRIGSGGSSISAILKGGGSQYILDGGEAWYTSLYGGAVQSTFGTGSAISNVIMDGGIEYVESNGQAFNTSIGIGGSQVVRYAGSTTDVQIFSSGTQEVYSGGVANRTTIYSHGQQILSEGGIAYSTTLLTSAVQTISSGGIASATTVNLADQYVQGETAQAVDTVLNTGGLQKLTNGAQAIGTVINSEAEQQISNGTAVSTLINSGGLQYVVAGSASSTILSGGGQSLYDARAYKTVINEGEQFVSKDAIAQDTTIFRGSQIVSSGAATSTAIYAGGLQTVSNGGTATSTSIYTNGLQVVSSGGTATSTAIYEGGLQTISSGGIAQSTGVYGGQQDIYAATATYTAIANGGIQNLDIGAQATSTLISDGGSQVLQRASAQETVISNGTQIISLGANAFATTIAGGTQHIFEFGSATSTLIKNAGSQLLESNATATSTAIYAGVQQISSGAQAHSTGIYGGTQQILAGGSSYVTEMTSGAITTGSATVVSSVDMTGGSLSVASGAVAADVRMADGTISVASGGSLSGLTATGGTLNISGSNTLANYATLGPAAVNLIRTGHTPTVLTVPDLTANGTTFAMNVDLLAQTADKLAITNSYSGNAQLVLTNIAPGANDIFGDGIKLVEFSPSTAVNGTFSLLGDKWEQGAYEFMLAQGTKSQQGRDYYLRSTSQYTNLYKGMLNIPALNVHLARAGMNSLQKRLGDLQDLSNTSKKQGIWARTYYKDMTVKELISTDVQLFGAEAGYDWLLLPDETTRLYAGFMVGYSEANRIKAKRADALTKGDGNAPSVGLYATLINENAWFIDIAARNFWTKTDMTSYASNGMQFDYTPKRNVFALSMEGGKNLFYPLNDHSWLRLTPKLELSTLYAAGATAGVKNGFGDLEYKGTSYLSAKAGILLGYNYRRVNGLTIEPLVEVAYSREMLGKNKVSYAGAEETASAKGGTFEADLGLNMQLSQNLYWYLLGSYETGPKLQAWGAHAGIRYVFGAPPTAAYKTALPANRSSEYTRHMLKQQETVSYVPLANGNYRQETTTLYTLPNTVNNSVEVTPLPNQTVSDPAGQTTEPLQPQLRFETKPKRVMFSR